MRQMEFGKAVQCKRGNFAVGEALPAYLCTAETIRQFREQFGEDVLVESKDAVASMQDVLASLRRIERALGIGSEPPANGKTARQARAKLS